MNNLSHKRLVDRLIDAYVNWREACLRVSDAYDSWTGETGPGGTSAFGSYMAALEQEERAAEVYAGLVRRVGELVSSKDDAVEPLAGRRGDLARDDAGRHGGAPRLGRARGPHRACWARARTLARARLSMLSSHQLRLVWD